MTDYSLERGLPCGCRLCGCLCEQHAHPFSAVDVGVDLGRVRLCLSHRTQAVLLAVLHEAGTLVSLALFGGMIAVWAAILGHL